MTISDRCPKTMIEPWTWQLADLADRFNRHGAPPVAGGVLDQTPGFVAAANVIAAESARIEAAEREAANRGRGR